MLAAHTYFKFFALAAVLSVSALSITNNPATAAPQILGLIASAEPIPLTCNDGTCTAEVSSICLQQVRDVPENGTAYTPAPGTRITLNVRAADGSQHSMPVTGDVSLTSSRLFLAVKVSVPEDIVRRLGRGAASLSVSDLASAIPVPVAGDPDPMSQREIAAYTGPLRASAGHVVKQDQARLHATRTLNQMINHLPTDRLVGIEAIEPLWQQTVRNNATASHPMGSKGMNIARRAMDDCHFIVDKGVGYEPGLRACLSNQHDILSTETTKDVWKALTPGS